MVARTLDRAVGGEDCLLDLRLCLGIASKCHQPLGGRFDRRGLVRVRPVPRRLRRPGLSRHAQIRTLGLGRTGRVPGASASRAGPRPISASLESPSLSHTLASKRRAHSGTATKFRAAVGRNAAFMRQGPGLTPDCRINAAFRRAISVLKRLCRDSTLDVIPPLDKVRFVSKTSSLS